MNASGRVTISTPSYATAASTLTHLPASSLLPTLHASLTAPLHTLISSSPNPASSLPTLISGTAPPTAKLKSTPPRNSELSSAIWNSKKTPSRRKAGSSWLIAPRSSIAPLNTSALTSSLNTKSVSKNSPLLSAFTMKTTSSNSANSSAAEQKKLQYRTDLIDQIRHLIAKENITPDELSIPSSYDLIPALAAIRSFPFSLSPLKILILLILANKETSQQKLREITLSEESHLSHVLANLREYGLITRDNSRRPLYSLTTSGRQLFSIFLAHYYQSLYAIQSP